MLQLASLQHGSHRFIDAEILVVLTYDLNRSRALFGEHGEVLNHIQEALRLAHAADQHFKGNPARLIFPFNALPLKEAFPDCCQRADAAINSIRGNEHRKK